MSDEFLSQQSRPTGYQDELARSAPGEDNQDVSQLSTVHKVAMVSSSSMRQKFSFGKMSIGANDPAMPPTVQGTVKSSVQ